MTQTKFIRIFYVTDFMHSGKILLIVLPPSLPLSLMLRCDHEAFPCLFGNISSAPLCNSPGYSEVI